MEAVPGEKLLPQDEVIKILPISARTLQRRRWDGSIKALALNSKVFVYPKSSIDSFLAALYSGKLQTRTYDTKDRPRIRVQSAATARRLAFEGWSPPASAVADLALQPRDPLLSKAAVVHVGRQVAAASAPPRLPERDSPLTSAFRITAITSSG
jgi:hypothetical protein